MDKLLAELENEAVPEESNKPKKTEKEIDEEYLSDMKNADVDEIPKGKEKYYGL